MVWLRDVAAFRVVALSDLITHQFDGHTFAGRRGRDRGGGATGVDRARRPVRGAAVGATAGHSGPVPDARARRLPAGVASRDARRGVCPPQAGAGGRRSADREAPCSAHANGRGVRLQITGNPNETEQQRPSGQVEALHVDYRTLAATLREWWN